MAGSGDAFHNTLLHFMKCLGMSLRDDDVLVGSDRGRQGYSAFEPIDRS